MAEYIIIVTVDPTHLPALDQRLVMHGFDTAIEPQPPNGFVLPRGMYRLFAADTDAGGVHGVVAGHMQHLNLQGAILVFEKEPEAPFAQSGHPHWVGGTDLPVSR